MCTILFAFKKHPDFPLIVAANRDEFYGRPTVGPQRLAELPVIVGGKDLEHGGTWMGLNEHGVFVGLTNRPSSATGRRSRGELVLEALTLESIAEIDELLRSEAAHCEFRPFNLLYGTSRDLRVAHVPDGEMELIAVEPGLHVLPSGGRLNDLQEPRVSRGLHHLKDALRDPARLVERLDDALLDADIPALEDIPPPNRPLPFDLDTWRRLHAINVSTPVYGTRSSTIVLLGENDVRYYYADRDNGSHLHRIDHLLKA